MMSKYDVHLVAARSCLSLTFVLSCALDNIYAILDAISRFENISGRFVNRVSRCSE